MLISIKQVMENLTFESLPWVLVLQQMTPEDVEAQAPEIVYMTADLAREENIKLVKAGSLKRYRQHRT